MRHSLKNAENREMAHASVVRLQTKVPSDQDIVDGLKRGDSMAANGLVDRYGLSIDRRIWRLLGADSEHNDVVQQVYTQILQSIGTIRDAKALADWIVRVTVNVARNELRSRKYRRIIKLDENPANELLDTVSPEDRLLLLRGFKILENMKVEHRIIFVMRYIEGASLPEVASATECSLATIKRRLERARNVFLKKAGKDLFLSSLVNKDAGDE